MEPMLEVIGVSKNFGGLPAADHIDMRVLPGEVHGLIGPNGAGKTTLLKAISGVKRPAAGSIVFNGEDLVGLSVPDIVERGVVQVPEGRKLFPQMTVQENLELGAYLKGPKKHRKESLEYVYEMLPDLKIKAAQPAGSLSGGQQQMVAIGRGMMSMPKMLIFDEPSIGLSPLLTDIMFDIIGKIKDSGVTIMLVEQNVQYALSMADRGYVLEQGKIAMEGAADELLANNDLKRAYLGL